MTIPELEIIVHAAGDEVLRLTVRPGDYVIGSAETADLRLLVPEVADRHALLTVNYDHAFIESLDGNEGVLVNDVPIRECTRLWPNQKVQVGLATVSLRRKKMVGTPDESLAPATEALRRLLPEEFLREQKYDIGGVVAQGGMGAILDAREATTGRTVAMKVMLDGSQADDLSRFIAEARATAQLEHPNIVPVHELSVDENEQVFYTMKFVRGVTLRQVLEQLAAGSAETMRQFPLPTRLTIFQKACDAIAFAHSRGVLHRDLKPENIMVGEYGEVLVMDWGLAKTVGAQRAASDRATTSNLRAVAMADSVNATAAGTIMGTPAYMSPEQARGEVETLDVRSDVYALGTILYQILALRPSVTGQDAVEIVDKVAQGETEALPSTPSVPASLSAVVQKAMAFDREARYPDVPAFQAEITAYQAGFATAAERAGPWKQAVLFVRRNRAVSTAVAAALVLLAAVTTGFTTRVVRERNRAETGETAALRNATEADAQRTRAVAALAQSEETLLQMQYRKALEALDRDEPAEGLAWLAAVLRQRPEHPSAGPLIVSTLSERSFPLPVGEPIRHTSPEQASLQFLPDGRLLASSSGSISLWDFATGQYLNQFRGSERVTYTPDGRFLLIGSGPEWLSKTDRDAGLDVVEIAGGKTIATFKENDVITARAVNPAGTRLATGEKSGRIKIWRLPECVLERDSFSEGREVERLMWSYDGQWLAASRTDWTVAKVWNLTTGVEGAPFAKDGLVRAFAPTGERVVTGSFQVMDFTGKLLATPNQTFAAPLLSHPAVFAPTERRLAIIPKNRNEIRLLETASGDEWFPALRMSDRPVGANFSPEGSRVFGRAEDGTAQLWDAVLGEKLGETFAKQGSGWWRPAIAPDGEHIALPTATGFVEKWTIHDGRTLAARLRPVETLSGFKPNPAATVALALSRSSSPHQLIDLATGNSRALAAPHQNLEIVEFTKDGSKLALSGEGGIVTVWDTETCKRISPEMNISSCYGLAFSHDENRLAISHYTGGVVVDWRTGEELYQLGDGARGGPLRWSVDGTRILSCGFTGPTCFDAKTGKELWWAGRAGPVAVRPDFIQFAYAPGNNLVSFRSMATGKPEGPTLPHEQDVTTMAYSPDGTVLATGSRDHAARLWSVETRKLIGGAMRHEGSVVRVVFSPDGRRLATTTDSGAVRLWDVTTAQPLTLVLPHPGVKDVFFTDDGRRLVVASDNGSIYFHDVPLLPQPAPAWLADLAEAVAQRNVDKGGETSRTGALDIAVLQMKLAELPGDDDYARWVRWFFADRATRMASAYSNVRMTKAIYQLVALGSLAELEEARRRNPTDTKIMTLLAKKYREKSEPASAAHADFLDALATWNTATGAAARILEAQTQMRVAAAAEAARFAAQRERFATMRPLDLAGYFNNDLNKSLGQPDSPWNLSALPRRLQLFNGTLFDVQRMIVVRGIAIDPDRPERVAGIAVRKKARTLHVLQGANFYSQGGARIAGYVLHYADGEKRDLPVVYGEDVCDWNMNGFSGGPLKNASTAWTGPGGSTLLRLYHRAYENPRPDVEITSLDFVSASEKATPFVVAITLE